ncbi:hypothetical protein SMICM304S_00968 [Streptomyces microflavus]
MPKKARNTRLAALQQEARWTNGDLAREVNRLELSTACAWPMTAQQLRTGCPGHARALPCPSWWQRSSATDWDSW